MTDDDEGASRPRRAVEEVYVSCLDARNLWVREASAGFPSHSQEELHALLHAEVMNWYETLAPFLEDRDQVDHYWERVRLWPVDYQYAEVLYCPACTNIWDDSTLEPGDGCPECGLDELEAVPTSEFDDEIVPTRVVVDQETGEPKMVWKRGLESLQDYRTRSTTVTETVGTFRKRTVTRTQPDRLDPDVLLRVARMLDQAADKLGLVADVEVDVPTTEVDKETLDEARDQIEQLVEQYGDADPYEGEAAAGGDD